jgi:hypothetical protein
MSWQYPTQEETLIEGLIHVSYEIGKATKNLSILNKRQRDIKVALLKRLEELQKEKK